MSAHPGQLLNPSNESNTSESSASFSCPSNLPVPVFTPTVPVLTSDAPCDGPPSIGLQWQSGPSRDGVDAGESEDPFYDTHGENNASTLRESNPYASFITKTNRSVSLSRDERNVNKEDEIVMEPEPTKSKKQDKGKGRATDASARNRHRDIEQDTDEDADGEDDPYEDYYYSAFGKDRKSIKGSRKRNNSVSSKSSKIKKVVQSTTPAKRSNIAPESRPVSPFTFTTTLVHSVEEEESDTDSSVHGSITPASSPTSSWGLARKASTESFSSTSTIKPAKRSSQKAAPATTSPVPNTGSPTAPPRPPRSAKRVSSMSTTSSTISATKPVESNRRELSPSMSTPNHSSGCSLSATFASTRGGPNRCSAPFKLPTTATDSTPHKREARNKASAGSKDNQTSSAIPSFSAHRTRYPLDRIDSLPFALCLGKGYSVYRIEECKNYYYLTFKNVKASWSYRIISKSLEYVWEYE